MAKELEKDPAELPNTEFKSFTSQGLPRERKDNEVPYFDDLGQCEAFYNDELGIFPDINDEEVDGYLLNEDERRYKNKIWEDQYQEYEEQAAEEAVAAAKKEFYDAIVNKCMEDVHEARKHYESAVAALAKLRKEMKERRAQIYETGRC